VDAAAGKVGKEAGPGGGGCLRLMLAGPVLLLGAPVVALMRSLARRKRGRAVRLDELKEEKSGGFAVFSGAVDFPSGTESSRILTAALASLASTLSGPGDAHYLLHDDGEDGVVLGLGPSIQDLCERFEIMCRKHSVEGRNLLWLSMDTSEHIGRYFRSGCWDAKTEGNAALDELPLHWALEIRRKRGAVSTRWELRIRVPEEKERYGREFFGRIGA